mgnify:CR=1 FL=1
MRRINRDRMQMAVERRQVIPWRRITNQARVRERKRPTELVGKSYTSEEVLGVIEKMEKNKHQPDFHHSDEENHTEALARAQ